jgi:uncharacterized membrane protein YidH (DUF202 family)
MVPAHRDPGLQPERTDLAWRRTSLATTVVALLAARLAALRHAPIGVVAAGLLWIAALAVVRIRSARLLALVAGLFALLGTLLVGLTPAPPD